MWVTNYSSSIWEGLNRKSLFSSRFWNTQRITTTKTNDVFVHESKRNNAAVRFSLGSNNDGLTWNWLFHDYAAQTQTKLMIYVSSISNAGTISQRDVVVYFNQNGLKYGH